jgi:hypothetical protein
VTPQHEESKVGFSSYGLTIETTAGLLARTANRKHRGNVICGKRTGLAKTLTVVKHHRADNKCRRRCIAGVSKRDAFDSMAIPTLTSELILQDGARRVPVKTSGHLSDSEQTRVFLGSHSRIANDLVCYTLDRGHGKGPTKKMRVALYIRVSTKR